MPPGVVLVLLDPHYHGGDGHVVELGVGGLGEAGQEADHTAHPGGVENTESQRYPRSPVVAEQCWWLWQLV